MQVHAFACDTQHIHYTCNECHGIHCHGSDGNLNNRTENRLSHCNGGEDVQIVIDDTTNKRVKPFPWKQVASISDVQYYPLASLGVYGGVGITSVCLRC